MIGSTNPTGAGQNASPGYKEEVCQKEPGSLGKQQQGGSGLRALKLLPPKSKEVAIAGPTYQAGAGRNASLGFKEQGCQKESGNLAESSLSHQQEGRGAGSKSSAKVALLLPKKKEMAMAGPKS